MSLLVFLPSCLTLIALPAACGLRSACPASYGRLRHALPAFTSIASDPVMTSPSDASSRNVAVLCMNSWLAVAASVTRASYTELHAESAAQACVIVSAASSDSTAVAANGNDRIGDMQ